MFTPRRLLIAIGLSLVALTPGSAAVSAVIGLTAFVGANIDRHLLYFVGLAISLLATSTVLVISRLRSELRKQNDLYLAVSSVWRSTASTVVAIHLLGIVALSWYLLSTNQLVQQIAVLLVVAQLLSLVFHLTVLPSLLAMEPMQLLLLPAKRKVAKEEEQINLELEYQLREAPTTALDGAKRIWLHAATDHHVPAPKFLAAAKRASEKQDKVDSQATAKHEWE